MSGDFSRMSYSVCAFIEKPVKRGSTAVTMKGCLYRGLRAGLSGIPGFKAAGLTSSPLFPVSGAEFCSNRISACAKDLAVAASAADSDLVLFRFRRLVFLFFNPTSPPPPPPAPPPPASPPPSVAVPVDPLPPCSTLSRPAVLPTTASPRTCSVGLGQVSFTSYSNKGLVD